MAEDAHPVITLLISRMKSHPEEFRKGARLHTRWTHVIDQLRDVCPYEQMKELEAVLADIHMDELHERVMNMLLNGDQTEQDATAKQAATTAAKLLAAQHAQQNHAQSALAQHQLQNAYSQAATATATGLYNPTSSTLAGTLPNNLAMGVGTATPSTTLNVSDAALRGGEKLRVSSNGDIEWEGGIKLTKRMVRRMKEMLGI